MSGTGGRYAAKQALVLTLCKMLPGALVLTWGKLLPSALVLIWGKLLPGANAYARTRATNHLCLLPRRYHRNPEETTVSTDKERQVSGVVSACVIGGLSKRQERAALTLQTRVRARDAKGRRPYSEGPQPLI
eukprot:3876044-Rhodomonas_salina.1